MRSNTMAGLPSLRRRTQHRVLGPREALLLDNAQGAVLTVERGCLWVTLEHDPRDIILATGMRFEIDRPGRTVIAAETRSTLRLRSPVSRGTRLAVALARAAGLLRAAWSGRSVRETLPHAELP
jgi:Protein of unknown function (DUF2917)